MSTDNKELLDNIWKTSKTRMITEERYRSYDLAAHILTSYYALMLIVSSIFSAEIVNFTTAFDKISISLAVIVFSLTLILGGFRYSETADKHRNCYLKLQEILRDTSSTNLAATYSEILKEYPNHSPQDYDRLVVESTIYRNKPIIRSGSEEPIHPTMAMIFMHFVRRLRFPIFAYIIPISLPFLIVGFTLAKPISGGN